MPTSRSPFFRAFRGAGTHRDVLRRTAAENHGAVNLAREALRQERERASGALHEHRRALAHARIQAKREGRQLLKLLDNLPRPG